MRFAPLVLAALLFAPAPARAGAILWMEFLDSDLYYGTIDPGHYGNYGDALHLWDPDAPDDVQLWGGFFEATGAHLVEHHYDPATQTSTYRYEGGTFDVELPLWREDGRSVTGHYRAPILSLLVTAEDGPGGYVDPRYVLGPGVFDAPVARLLRIDPHSPGGIAYSSMGGYVCPLPDPECRPSDIAGDYTTEKRHAWDGATWFEIETEPAEMPEPPLGLLGLLGAAGTWARYGRWRRG
jgi:hypothetical protein